MKLTKLLGAYLAASGSTLGVGLVGTELARWAFEFQGGTWVITGGLWIVVVGIPSLAWTNRYLSATLGLRQPVTVRPIAERRIPVFGAFGDTLAAVVPGMKRPGPAMTVADEFRLERVILTARGTERRIVLDERWCDYFVKKAFTRQRAGETYPLSRNWWVDRGRRVRREEWELAMDVLGWCDLIHGSARRLRFPPLTTMHELKHRWGGWEGLPPPPPEAW